MGFENQENQEKQTFTESTGLTGSQELLANFDAKGAKVTSEQQSLVLEKQGTIPSLHIDGLDKEINIQMGGFENDKGFTLPSAGEQPWDNDKGFTPQPYIGMGGFENDKGFTPQAGTGEVPLPDDVWRMGGFENDKGFAPDAGTGDIPLPPDVWRMGGFENDKGFTLPSAGEEPWKDDKGFTPKPYIGMGGFENDKGFTPQVGTGEVPLPDDVWRMGGFEKDT